LVGNPNNGPKTVKTWFNTAVYQKQAAGTFGNSSRNDLLGPSVSNVDTGAWRSFNLEKSLKLEMRVDAFNVFNPYPAEQPVQYGQHGKHDYFRYIRQHLECSGRESCRRQRSSSSRSRMSHRISFGLKAVSFDMCPIVRYAQPFA
jgi:hypothetical protein